MRNSRGFSLVELLGTIVILGILSSIAIVALSRYQMQAANQAFDTMSKDAASAAEEYFMDHMNRDSVDIKTLVDEEYLSDTIDPRNKSTSCSGTVTKTSYAKSGNSLETINLQVNLECTNFNSCKIYPGGDDCPE